MTPYTFSAPVRTDRLTIRLMTENDADDIASYHGREDVCEYLPYEPRSRDDVAERVAKHASATTLAADGDYWQLAAELPASGDRPARVVGDIYLAVKSVEHFTGAIGWVLHPDFAGRGYVTEAASAVLDLAFDSAGLHRVIAEYYSRNTASVALCRRLGMREQARFRRDMRFRSDWADTGISAILAEKWAAQRR